MEQFDLHAIKIVADTIMHCGDYGQCYVNPKTEEVMLVLGDADDTDYEILVSLVEELGFKLIVECEDYPLDDWILVSKGVVADFDDSGSYDLDSATPSLLSVSEYASYLALMETL